MSKSTYTANKSSKPGSGTDTSTTLPSSPIYLPSTVASAEEWWTSLREDFHARISQSPEQEPESTGLEAAFGGRCLESFGKWDRDTSSLKTYQVSLWTGQQELWSGSFPPSGTMRSGIAYRLHPLVPRTSVGGGGVLPTWTTPQAQDAKHSGHGLSDQQRDLLSVEVVKTGMWPTPKAQNATGAGEHGQGGRDLQTVVHMWPTPRASEIDYSDKIQGLHGMNYIAKDGREWGINLTGAVKTWPEQMWPTPKTPTGGGQVERTTPGGGIRKLEDKVSQIEGYNTGQLNPGFVEFLMGVPQGWTSLEPLDPAAYQRWLTEPHWEAGEWPGVERVATGVKDRVARLKMLGNGIVPMCIAKFLGALTTR